MTTPYYADDQVTLYLGDCLAVLRSDDYGYDWNLGYREPRLFADNSVDAVVCDPPYGLEFMGKDWDAPWKTGNGFRRAENPSDAGRDNVFGRQSKRGPEYFAGSEFQQWCTAWASECLRVLKPGGHLVAFGGSRTWHRLAAAVEDAGFEIRDSIAWLTGSGFPKSLDVSKAIDKAAGAERTEGAREWSGGQRRAGVMGENLGTQTLTKFDTPATDAAKRWEGWGTALKPAFEPLVCARKPLSAVPLDWRLVATAHHALAGLLWLSLSPAKRAEALSQSKNHGQRAGWCASALVSAATDTSLDEFAPTATFNSQATASTCWNIASSWSAILDALSDPTSMYTTSTRSSTTTGLKILNSLLAPTISLTTMPACECLRAGQQSNALSADDDSTDEWAKWLHTQSATAQEPAIESTAVAVCNALASIAESLFIDQAAESTAQPSATTKAAGRGSAFEPIMVGRKPLAGTVAANVLQHGTGALNIDGCRIHTPGSEGRAYTVKRLKPGAELNRTGGNWRPDEGVEYQGETKDGRWPTNVVLDAAQAAELDAQSGVSVSRKGKPRAGANGDGWGMTATGAEYDDEGGASRFFPVFRYEAKAPGAERPSANGVAHPTVKPLDLMRWLVRLVTPPNGVVLDPFAGSGTTAEACIHEHMRCITVEREADYLPLITARLTKPMEVGFDFGSAS